MFIKLSRSNSINILSTFIIWRSLLIVVAMLYGYFFSYQYTYSAISYGNGSLFKIFYPWANFDGIHYLTISSYGYSKLQYAFFPGYPGIISIVEKVWPDPLAIALIISNLSALILLFLLYKLIKMDFGEQIANKTIWIFLAYPAAFFLGAAYNESLFLCLVVGSFLSAKKGNFWLAAILGIGASVTRLVGIFLIPAILLIWWTGDRKKKDLLLILLIGAGTLGVCIRNYIGTGDPLSFVHSQPLFGANRSGGEIVLLPQVLFRYLKIFLTNDIITLRYYVAVQEFVLVILSVIVIWIGRKKISLPYIVYSLGVILTPTFTGTFSSMPRYILAAFPIFIIISQMIKARWKYILLLALMFLFEIINTALFTNGYFVS